MKRLLCILLFLISISVDGLSQKIDIDWIEVSGNKVVIHYSLIDTNPNHQYLVNLLTSHDNFTSPLTKVSGDVGQEVRAGKEKEITWDITKELNAFKGNISFEVRARVFVPFVKLTGFEEDKVFKRGKNYPINWDSGNLSGQVNIELFKNQVRISGDNNQPNIGKYDWFIPGNTKKGKYRLRFTNTKDRKDFVETKEFIIKPKIPAIVKIMSIAALGSIIYFVLPNGSGNDPAEPEEPLAGNPGKPN